MVQVIKNSFASAGDEKDMGSIPGSGRPPGGGHGNLPQYSYLENPMDRGAWWATVHWDGRLQFTELDTNEHTHIHLHTHCEFGVESMAQASEGRGVSPGSALYH